MAPENALAVFAGKGPRALYDSDGACPLSAEKGKVILAEFGCGGDLLPIFPLNPRVPQRGARWLKAKFMPTISWDRIPKGRERPAVPTPLPHEPAPREAKAAMDDKAPAAELRESA